MACSRECPMRAIASLTMEGCMLRFTPVRAAVLLALTTASLASAQNAPSKVYPQGGTMSAEASKAKAHKMSSAELIRSATSAGPRSISDNATVMAADASGKMVQLRPGTNGWTCIPDEPSTPGLDPMCIDKNGMEWVSALIAKAPKPKNTAPGLIYMLEGGSDISATDPFATKTDHYVSSPAHYMIMWPYDAKSTGFTTTPKKTGTWIMWAGTPYAHLMVNQTP
jgi:hypothetical protein